MNFSGITSFTPACLNATHMDALSPDQQMGLWLSIKSAEEGRKLLNKGLNVNVHHAYGTPLLHFVAKFTDINGVLREPVFTPEHRQTLEALLACGADPTICCWYFPECSVTALQLNQHPEIRQILENHLKQPKG